MTLDLLSLKHSTNGQPWSRNDAQPRFRIGLVESSRAPLRSRSRPVALDLPTLIVRAARPLRPRPASATKSIRRGFGRPITRGQVEELSDERLAGLVPKAYREFLPGKDCYADSQFHLHDGTT